MTLSEELSQIDTIFIDTAPIIYYIEANPEFGPLTKEVVGAFQSGTLTAFASVLTLVEVLPKPIEAGQEDLARRFSNFLRHGKNLSLVEISEAIAEKAGKLKGKFSSLRTLDAIQVATALEVKAEAFLTNDRKLKQITEIKIFILKDYLR